MLYWVLFKNGLKTKYNEEIRVVNKDIKIGVKLEENINSQLPSDAASYLSRHDTAK